MSVQFIPNAGRGHVQSGWLKSAHSFSFGRYVNAARRNFGALAVVNEDWIAPGAGFSEHPHQNMEIVTVVLEGVLEHADSMGNTGRIEPGMIQAMSAGTGVLHSEGNASTTSPLHLLQIWIKPNQINGQPRYKQWRTEIQPNDWSILASSTSFPEQMNLYQEAEIALGDFTADTKLEIPATPPERGCFLLLLSGSVRNEAQQLEAGDSLEITNESAFTLHAKADTKILRIHVPILEKLER
ncbi:MAG TPA: pirin family protein [bacterium]|nr:pirin family protein [bacterium]